MRRFLASLFLLFASVAFGAGTTATMSWDRPLVYTDGSVLPASDIKNYTLSWSRTSGGPAVGSLVVNAPALTSPVTLVCSDYFFLVTVTTTASAKVPNATSGPSNIVPYATGVNCAPGAPTNLTAS